MPSQPISNPAAYVAASAVAFSDNSGNATVVSSNAPLPVRAALPQASPLTGTTTTSGQTALYQPVVGRSVILMLSGSWSGTVTVVRTVDGGATCVPLTSGGAPSAIFTTNCCEAVWDESEAAAQLALVITLAAGTVTYRIAQ